MINICNLYFYIEKLIYKKFNISNSKFPNSNCEITTNTNDNFLR